MSEPAGGRADKDAAESAREVGRGIALRRSDLALIAIAAAAIVLPHADLLAGRPAHGLGMGIAPALPAAGFWLAMHAAGEMAFRRRRICRRRRLMLPAAAALLASLVPSLVPPGAAAAGGLGAHIASACLAASIGLTSAAGIWLLYSLGRGEALRLASGGSRAVSSRAPTRRSTLMGLALALGLAALVPRLWGIDWGLPYEYHSDEHLLYRNGLRPDFHPGTFVYPALMIYVNKALGWTIAALHAIANDSFSAALESQAVRIRTLHASRIVVALLSTMLTVVALLLLHRLGAPLWLAILGALLLAFSPGLVRHSHYDTVDVPCAALATVSILLMLLAVERRVPRVLLTASLVAGLAAGTKYSAALLLLPIAVSFYLLASRQGGPGTRLRTVKANAPLLTACAGLMALGFTVANPYAVIEWPRALAGILHQASHSRGGHLGAEPSLVEFITGPLAHELGPMGLILPCLTALIAVRQQPQGLLIAWLAWVLPFAVFHLSYLVKFSRWFITVVPAHVLLPVLAAIPRGLLRAAPVLAILLMLGESAVASWRIARDFTAPDTRTAAREWLIENAPPNASIALPAFDDPDRFAGAPQDLLAAGFRLEKIPILTRAGRIPAEWDPAHYVAHPVDYILWSHQAFGRYTDPRTAEAHPEVYAAYMRFAQWLAGMELAYPSSGAPPHFGPEIRIYRLRTR